MRDRNPLITGGNNGIVFVNNLVYNSKYGGPDIGRTQVPVL